jgi:hypothetical protein
MKKVPDFVWLWIGCFGVWPLADPGHEWNSLASQLDLVIHVIGWVVLATRYRVVKRT